MALTQQEKTYIDKLVAAGATKEQLKQKLQERRNKVKNQGYTEKVETGFLAGARNIGAGAIQAGGELAVGLPGQLSRLAPGDQSADPNSFYNQTQNLLNKTQKEMQQQGVDTDSTTYGVGKGVMNFAASTLGSGAVSQLANRSKLLANLGLKISGAGKVASGAFNGAKEGLAYDLASGDAPGTGTIAGGVLGAAFPIAGAVVKGGGKLLGKYLGKLPVNGSKAGAYTEGKAGELISKAADNLSTKFNRLDPTKEIEFKKMTGESVGEFLNKRGIHEAGERTVEKVSDLFQKSIREADEGLDLIRGKYKMDSGDDFVGIAIEDLKNKLAVELSPKRSLIETLSKKYDAGGLTQTEVNVLKRLYQENNKFGYLKEAVDPSGVARATNILDGIREWQFAKATENGFKNLDKVNKNTQAYKFLTREIQKKIEKGSGNNSISLSDWIVATGSPYGFGGVVSKKLLSTDKAKSLLLKGLNNGRKRIDALVKADKDGIIKEQVKKVYGLSDNSYSDLNFSSTLDRKGIRTLPPASGKPTTNSKIIDVKPVVTGPKGANPPVITDRSKIVQPKDGRPKKKGRPKSKAKYYQ